MTDPVPRTETGRRQPPSDRGTGGSRRPLTVGLVLMVTLFAFDNLGVTTAMPRVVDELGGLGLYGWAFSAYMIANVVGLSVAGQEADRRGPAAPLAAGLACFAAGLLVSGLASSMVVFVAGRALQGLGAGTFGTTAYVVIGRAYPAWERPRMFAYLSTAWVVPSLVGPSLAGLLADHLSWRWVVLGLLPFPPLLVVLAVIPLLHMRRVGERGPARLAPAIRVAAGVGLFVAGAGADQVLVGVGLAVAGAIVGVPALRRLLPVGTFTASSPVPAAIAVRGLVNFAFFATDAFIPLIVTGVRHRSSTIAGASLTAAALSWTLGSWVVAHRSSQWSVSSRVRVGLLLVASGIAITASGTWTTVPLVLVSVGWAVAGLGMGFAFNSTSVLVVEGSSLGREGEDSAALQLADAVGVAVGCGVAGALVDYFTTSGLGTAAGLRAVLVMTFTGAAVALVAARGIRTPGRLVE